MVATRLIPFFVGALLAPVRIQVPTPPLPASDQRPATASPAPRDYKTFARRPTVLSDDELNRLRAIVLARCGLAPTAKAAEAPWYFHYELGLELEHRGDPQRALDAFLEAAVRKARPARRSRMYGMWFRDYLPYFEIARAHVALGNWQCAADALRVSERAGEVGTSDRGFLEFQELKLAVQTAQGHHPH